MKKIIALLLALVMVFALVACGEKAPADTGANKPADTGAQAPADTGAETPDAPPADEPAGLDTENPIIIGHIADLTGNEAMTAAVAVQGMEFAIKFLNENGGIAGREVQMITADAQSNSATAADQVRKLIENDGVHIVVGPTQIGHKQTVAAVVNDAGVPAIYYNGTPAFLAKKFEYVLASGGGTSQMPTAMADYLYNDLGYRTIYTVCQEGTAGDNYVGPIVTNFEAMGGKVIKDIRVPGDATDMTAYLMNLEDADAVVAWLSGTQGVSLWTAWYDLGIADRMPMHGAVHGGFTDYFIWKQLANSRPEVVEKALELGVYAPINWAYSLDNEENKAFVEAWEAEFNAIAPGSNLPGACYSCLLIIKDAIESIDGSTDPEELYVALQTAEAISPEGHTKFEEGNRIAVKDVHIVKVVKLDNGDFNYEVVKTYADVPVNGLTVG